MADRSVVVVAVVDVRHVRVGVVQLVVHVAVHVAHPRRAPRMGVPVVAVGVAMPVLVLGCRVVVPVRVPLAQQHGQPGQEHHGRHDLQSGHPFAQHDHGDQHAEDGAAENTSCPRVAPMFWAAAMYSTMLAP